MEKKKYIIPALEIIRLDNEIALALESAPPVGPGEGALMPINEHINPYKKTLG